MDLAIFDPKGIISLAERNLIVTVVCVMLVVAIPMLVTLYVFAWKYRAGNRAGVKNAGREEKPERQHRVGKEIWLWAIPAAVICVLAVINWKSTHALDPSVPIASNVPPIVIQVVALEWKWLFIYPAQGIATVNYVEFPANTPVHFDLTADAPMSSFWIPQLGSQIYAMAAMQTQLNLMADTTGDFAGKDTEINGAGYAGMTFVAKSVTEDDFNAWVTRVRGSGNVLDVPAYNALAAQSMDAPQASYSSVDKNLYNEILMKYTAPAANGAGLPEKPGLPPNVPEPQTMDGMPGMSMPDMSPASSTATQTLQMEM